MITTQKVTDGVSNFFDEWFGVHGGREVFYADRKTREFIETPQQLQLYVDECHRFQIPAYVSVQPYESRDKILGLEKLFFDFDCERDLEKAWKESREFACALTTYYGVKPLVVFSGKKGYHVYVWLWSTVQIQQQREDFVKNVYERMIDKLLKGYKFETLDPSPLHDIKRLGRIPYSVHEKTGKLCQPIDLDRQPIDVLNLTEYRRKSLGPSFFEKVCREVKVRETAPRTYRTLNPSGKVRPCFENTLTVPLETGAGHKMRLGIATEYLNHGFSVNQVVGLFCGQVDFNESKTRYFVEDAQRKRYRPFKCSTIRELGFCLGSQCKIHQRRSEK